MNVFNVRGEMYDIEFTSTLTIELVGVKTTREIPIFASSMVGISCFTSTWGLVDLQKARDEVRNTPLKSTRQYSQTADRYGNFVCKYSLLYEEVVKPNSHPDHILSDWLKEFHANREAEYLFQVQLLENIEDQPVAYAGKAWDEEKYPSQTVGKVVVPKQDSFIAARKAFSRTIADQILYMG
ncbi:hypothetical protein LARI1_G001680 [Lachnellula arida]|uniref:Uncharacterized protein n=1 Tax=Lachnellula arida TaxID=1316785 RepID=A0A8T9BLF6_9HELO|nr:hypothetical protein LARI1_G001680 [Lachnellula arida]